MNDPLTSISLVILTLLSAAAWFAAVLRQRGRATASSRDAAASSAADHERDAAAVSPWPAVLMWVIIIVGTVLFGYRAAIVHQDWQPLEAHVDGLLLIGVLFAGTALFLQKRAGVRGLILFALPVLTVIFLWSVCASLWTFRPFGEIDSVWTTIHLASVYIGMVFFTVAAIAGGMYLYVQRRLRTSHDPSATRPFASLETIEKLIIRTSAFGFALLTLGLVTGLIIVVSDPDQRLGAGWWYSPKVVLAATVWVIYAVVMNVRHTTNFRGARAAWLSIAGLVLLIVTFGVATTLPPIEKKTEQSMRAIQSRLADEHRAAPVSRWFGDGAAQRRHELPSRSGRGWGRVGRTAVIHESDCDKRDQRHSTSCAFSKTDAQVNRTPHPPLTPPLEGGGPEPAVGVQGTELSTEVAACGSAC